MLGQLCQVLQLFRVEANKIEAGLQLLIHGVISFGDGFLLDWNRYKLRGKAFYLTRS
jgi:hypothetical protein